MVPVENLLFKNAIVSQEMDLEQEEGAADRLTLIEHENTNLRQLLASVAAILNQMRRTIEPLEEDQEDNEEETGLPIDIIYENIKDRIERSLGVLNDLVNNC